MNKISDKVLQIEQRFQELGIEKSSLCKPLNVSDAAIAHVFQGRTKLSDKFKKAALDLIEAKLIEIKHDEEREERLLNSQVEAA